MVKKLSFFEKIKICIRFFKNPVTDVGMIYECPYCRWIDVNQISEELRITNKRRHYKKNYKCNCCGASGRIKETWKR